MNTYFKLEFKKTLISWKTVLATLTFISVLMIVYFDNMLYSNGRLDGLDCYIYIEKFTYIGFIAPVVLALVYSTSIIKDRNTGFMDKILEIISIKDYFKVKFIVNALITGLMFFVSQVTVVIYLIINFGIKDKIDTNITHFSNNYNNPKIVCIILIILITTLSAVAFSTFMLGFVTAVNKKYIAFIFPLFYVVVTGIFFQALSFNVIINFNIIDLFNLIMGYDTNILSVIIYDLILMMAGTMLLYKFGYKRAVKKYS